MKDKEESVDLILSRQRINESLHQKEEGRYTQFEKSFLEMPINTESGHLKIVAPDSVLYYTGVKLSSLLSCYF